MLDQKSTFFLGNKNISFHTTRNKKDVYGRYLSQSVQNRNVSSMKDACLFLGICCYRWIKFNHFLLFQYSFKKKEFCS